jgi:hypothetical protein
MACDTTAVTLCPEGVSMTDLAVEGMAFIVFFCVTSFEEWLMHRYLMHRIFLGWKAPFRSHTLIHHHLFGADERDHLDTHAEGEKEQHKHHIRFAFTYSVICLSTATLMAMALQGLSGLPVCWGILAASGLYYVLYEYGHWCMHVPQQRWFERTSLFRWLDAHHRAHHRTYVKNLNVVVPLADSILHTNMSPFT